MKRITTLCATWVLAFALAACSGIPGTSATAATTVQTGATSSEVAATSTTATAATATAAHVVAGNSETHDDAEDYQWDSESVISIGLDGDSITTDGAGVTVDGAKATITSAGTYSLSGSLSDGQIVVDTEAEEVVRLILNGVDIASASSAPIYIANAEEVVLILADNTENTLSDGATYVFADATTEEPNAALYSAADLTIGGSGSLTVNGNYNDAIASQDGLVIVGGTIAVTAVDDGVRGKDYLVVKDGNITVQAGGDGLKSDNAEDASKGYISIETGVLTIAAGGDAISAETDVAVSGGELALASGGGSDGQMSEDASAKGIKAAVSVVIDGGNIGVDSADDAIHSNGSVTINGGALVLASGDDGIHADATLEVNAGDVRITQSYEGIESAVITINDGNIHLVASDDGVNVAGGNDGSGLQAGPGRGGGFRGGQGQASSQDAFTYTGEYHLYINGGYLVVDAQGDGLDANGAIVMAGGVVLVNGPTQSMNAALDYDSGFNITGGLLIATGSAGMAQAPGTASTQNSVLVNYGATQQAGTLVHVQDSEGNTVLTFAPAKEYQSIAFSSPELVAGATYSVYSGGSSTGTASDGLYEDGAYTAGTEYTSFTLTGVVTSIGSSMMR